MPRLNHSILIERSTDGSRDDYGNPTQTWATLATVRASVQPKKAAELAQLSQAGPVRGDYSVYLYPTDVDEGDRFRIVPDDGRLFQITGKYDEAGAHRHLKLDALLVTP